MSTTDAFCDDLIRRAEACGVEAVACDAGGSIADSRFAEGEAAAYRHAAELLRGAVAAAVEEEREASGEIGSCFECWRFAMRRHSNGDQCCDKHSDDNDPEAWSDLPHAAAIRGALKATGGER